MKLKEKARKEKKRKEKKKRKIKELIDQKRLKYKY